MHCKLDIEQAVIKKAIEAGTTKNIKPFSSSSLLVNKKDFPKQGQTFKIATEKSNDLNDRFGDKLSYVNEVKDGHEIIIKPSEALIDDYYSGYIESQGKLEQAETGIDIFGDSRILATIKNDKNTILDQIVNLQDKQEDLKIGQIIDLDSYSNSPEGIELGKGILTKLLYDEIYANIQKQIDNLYKELDQIKNSNEVNDSLVSSKYLTALGARDNNTTTTILNNIIKYSEETSEEYKLAKILLSYQDKNKTASVKIMHMFDPEHENTEAYIRPNENKIYLSLENINKYGEERFKQTFLHELIHSYTVYPFYEENILKLDKIDIEFKNNIEKLYKISKKYSKNKQLYGFTDEMEFISEILTNETFRTEIKSLKLSIWDRLIKIISNFLSGKSIFDKSEEVIYNYLNNLDKVKINKNLKREERQEKKEIIKPTFEKQYVFFKRDINKLKKELDRIAVGTDEYNIKKAELDRTIDRFTKATEEKDKEEYVKMALEYLQWIEDLTNRLPEDPDKYVIQELTDAFEILETFDRFDKDVAGKVIDLENKLMPYIFKHNLKTINYYNTSGKNITIEDVDDQLKDIRWSAKNFGSLLDLVNYIGRTIGSVIKNAQNTASTTNKMVEAVVQKEVDELNEYAKSNGQTLEQVYELFIQEKKNTLVLAQRYNSDGTVNPNYEKIQNTPELKKFYDFYQRVLVASQTNLPYKVGKFYVLNKTKSDLKSDFKKIIPVENILFDSFVSNEELIADMVPDMFRSNIESSKKSRDLGSGILEFAAYANNHAALSAALPEVRLLQKQLKYKQGTDGSLVERQFINPSNPKSKVNAEDSNIYKMVKIVIDMQLKGKMSLNKMTPINIKEIKDTDGEIIGYKQVHIEDIIDRGLKYNSMLRIGLAPVTSMANIIFGDISNFIESVGGRFFTIKQMNQATNIFFKQINYTASDKDSNLYKWLEKLNPLQELADYDIGANLIANKKKLSKEKLTELLYTMQKKGELYLQTRTMIAMLIHDGYINSKGENLKKGDEITADEALKLSDKIQRINQQIHGRYSQREAAALQQSVWYRMIIQFKKWLPTAVEQRFGDIKYDNRLGVEIEGRYRTLSNLFFTKEALTNFNIMLKGELSELEMYNMRKTLVEGVMLAATMLMFFTLRGDDDDKDKRKMALVKASLTLLNRASGDLVFFYSPNQLLHTATNALPLAKTATDILTVINNIPHAFYDEDSQFKSGSRKGQNKFYTKLGNVIVGVKPIQDIRRLLNEQMLEELN